MTSSCCCKPRGHSSNVGDPASFFFIFCPLRSQKSVFPCCFPLVDNPVLAHRLFLFPQGHQLGEARRSHAPVHRPGRVVLGHVPEPTRPVQERCLHPSAFCVCVCVLFARACVRVCEILSSSLSRLYAVFMLSLAHSCRERAQLLGRAGGSVQADLL